MKKIPFTFLTWALLIAVAVLCFPTGHALAADPGTGGTLLPMLGFAGLIDIFDTRTMLEAVEQMKRPGRFLRDMFFPADTPSDSESLDVDIVKGGRKMAPIVSPLMEGKVVTRSGFTTQTLKPGYIKPKMVTTAADLLKRLPGQTIYSGDQTIEDRAQLQLGKDLAELMDQIDRREEWMAASAMDIGKITMKIKSESGDKTVEVDFQMAASHKVTLAGNDLWDNALSDPLAKLASLAAQARKDSGVSPNVLILDSTLACPAFVNHAKVQKFMDMRAVDMGEIKPAQLPDGVSYVGRISYPGLFVDVYCYDEWYEHEDTGVLTPMVPAKKAWLGTTRSANRTQYAVIQDMEAIEGAQAAVARFPKSWITKDPAVRWLMVQSAPLPTMKQPDAFVSIQVLA
jgi:hypothetical protein